MTQEITLLEYARSIGKTKKAVECMVWRGELETVLRGGRRYVVVPSEHTQSTLTGALQATHSDAGAEEGILASDIILDELRAELRLMQANHLRDIELLEKRLSDVEGQLVGQEVTLRAWKPIVELAGRELGYYRPVQTREERERAVDGVSQRARPNRLLSVLGAIVKG